MPLSPLPTTPLPILPSLSKYAVLPVSHPDWMSDDAPAWNLRAVIWFLFPISIVLLPLILLLFLSCHFSASGPFSIPFFQELSNIFHQELGCFGMTLVEQLGDDSLWVVCAAIMHLCNFFFFYCFSPFLFYIFLLIWYRHIRWNGWWYQQVLFLCALFNRGNIERTSSLKICLTSVSVCLWRDWFCGLTWEKVYTDMRGFEVCICLWLSLIVLRWSCAVYRMFKSKY